MSTLLIKIYPYISTFLGLSLVVGFFIIFYDFTKPPPDPIQIIENASGQVSEPVANTNDNTDIDTTKSPMFTVNISGAVKTPGSYQLPPGSIIFDVIDSAGGLTTDADILNSNIDTGSIISNEQQIIIASKSEADNTASAVPAFFASTDDSGLININTADKTKLMDLTGIGEVTAQKIIDYRTTNHFDTIEELMEVKGIGEKSFEKLKTKISI